jgi:hypothetical protein
MSSKFADSETTESHFFSSKNFVTGLQKLKKLDINQPFVPY